MILWFGKKKKQDEAKAAGVAMDAPELSADEIAARDAEIAAKSAESEKAIAEIRAGALEAVEAVAKDTAGALVAAIGGKAGPGAVGAAVTSRLKG